MQEEFEDTNGVIRIHISKKNRQRNVIGLHKDVRRVRKYHNQHPYIEGQQTQWTKREINTTSASSGAETAYPSGAPGFTPGS
jgi:hypothetical protein